MALTTLKIKQTFGTLLPQKSKLNSIPAESLVRLVEASGKASYIRHKCYSTFLMRKIWKKRFIVVVNTALYIYNEATSKRPRNCICLSGYNCVRRVQADKAEWAFAITSGDGVMEDVIFACSTDQERREWMRRIRDSLFKANDRRQRKPSLAQHLAGIEPDDTVIDYEILEAPVYDENTGNKSVDCDMVGDSVFTTDTESSDDDDLLTQIHSYTSDEETYEVGIWCRLKRKGAIKKRRTRRVNAVSSESGVERQSVKL